MYSANSTPMQNLETLSRHPYPGRFLVMGYAGDVAVQAYAIGGRSEGSKNRIFVLEDNIVSTEVFDTSKSIPDPTLTIYDAMRSVHQTTHVVSNGNQTDTVMQYLRSGSTFEAAMKLRHYEPDEPNYTPRISGFIDTARDPEDGGFAISVIRKADLTPKSIHDYHSESLAPFESGVGYAVHTYRGETGDGRLLSFNERPFKLPLEDTAESMAKLVWASLNADTRAAVVAKVISATGEIDFHIINQHER